jgi:peptide methionine sulfoxide reductase msrA/msrB
MVVMKINTKAIMLILLAIGAMLISQSCSFSFGSEDRTVYKDLTPEEEAVIINKGTERPFTGEFVSSHDDGTYTCKQCSAELYRSDDKFDSHCGWPSFDDAIDGAVKRIPDPDGYRIEIVCANCGGHLGHVFLGEGLTSKNTRYCVNSISLEFTPKEKSEEMASTDKKADKDTKYEKAIFASGCFWGVEYQFKQQPGVIETTVGFTGGDMENPSYKAVCTGNTGHAEAVEVVFDPQKTSYEQLAKIFFETHDFTQVNRQGPDIGEQYRSEIFYMNDQQRKTAEKLFKILEKKGYEVATKLTKAGEFFSAEEYHQDYYDKTGKTPYCHVYKKIFD